MKQTLAGNYGALTPLVYNLVANAIAILNLFTGVIEPVTHVLLHANLVATTIHCRLLMKAVLSKIASDSKSE